jgi:hypothetical protein
MPFLDADALTTDVKGLDYLAGVLEVPVEHPAPAWAGPADATTQKLLPELTIDNLVGRRRRKRIRLVPEAA